ncbi:MAG: metabolite traffic protein EboE [Planctomycetota bacterium]|jgi:hypothetical protein|nr:metabolite traffic protein EboE [Planctomycetota bacterium]
MLPLAYNSNLHPAETVDEMCAAITNFAAPLRQRLGWDEIGIDLRLGSTAIHQCQSDQDAIGKLRRALDQAKARAFTINAFPLSPFQTERVKDQAYHPDWNSVERLHDTIAAIGIASALSDEALITISTCPGSHKPWGPAVNQPLAIAAAFGHWAAAAWHHHQATGRRVVLCPEPEPWCTLENSHEVAAFWRDALPQAGLDAAAANLDGDRTAAAAALAQHLALCWDTCHISVAFEDQAEAVQRVVGAGARPLKVQFSACPEAPDLATNQAGLQSLLAMDEPRFLHQSALLLPDGSISQCRDLDGLPATYAAHPEASAARSHFHIPIDAQPAAPGLISTVEDSLSGLAACRPHGLEHIAVETYTWSILAESAQDALEGTARELEWLAQKCSC